MTDQADAADQEDDEPLVHRSNLGLSSSAQLHPTQELRVDRHHDRREAHHERPDAHRQDDAPRRQHAGRDGDGQRVVARSPRRGSGPSCDTPRATARWRWPRHAGRRVRGRSPPTRRPRRCRHRSRFPRRPGRAPARRSRRPRPWRPRTPPAWKRFTASALSAGRTCAATSLMPTRRATESATACASPVIIATRRPAACNRRTASHRLGADLVLERQRTDDVRAVDHVEDGPSLRAPGVGHARHLGSDARLGARPGAAARRPHVDADLRPPWHLGRGAPRTLTRARDGCRDRRAARTTARASGCSESASTAAATARTLPSSMPGAATRPLRTGWPRVRVPVLSKMTTCRSLARSSANRSFTSSPLRAPRVVLMATTRGIASPSACGHAMTRTVAVRMSASSGCPATIHAARVRTPGPERDEEEEGRGAVGEHLRARLRRLRLGDQPHDPRQRRCLAHRGHADAQAATGRHRPRHHPIIGLLGDRSRLAGDHRLVTSAAPSTTTPSAGTRVPGRTRSTSPSATVPSGTVSGLHRRRPARRRRGAGRPRLEGALGLHDRAHLDPVPQAHDGDERRQLPPHVDLEQAQRRGPRRDEGDHDGERDEGHHPRLAIAQLGARALQEDPAAVREDDRPQHRRDPARSGEVRGHVAQPVLDLLRSRRPPGSSAAGRPRTGAETRRGRARRACCGPRARRWRGARRAASVSLCDTPP